MTEHKPKLLMTLRGSNGAPVRFFSDYTYTCDPDEYNPKWFNGWVYEDGIFYGLYSNGFRSMMNDEIHRSFEEWLTKEILSEE